MWIIIILLIIMNVGPWNTEILKAICNFMKCSMPGLCAWFKNTPYQLFQYLVEVYQCAHKHALCVCLYWYVVCSTCIPSLCAWLKNIRLRTQNTLCLVSFIEGYTLFFYPGVYNLHILHTASLVDQDWEKSLPWVYNWLTSWFRTDEQWKTRIFNITSKAILLLWYMYMYMYLLYQGVYDLQILHTSSLVCQD